jgi:hypothetical protein
MVSTCKVSPPCILSSSDQLIYGVQTAGVGVIADTLFNHMAGVDSGTGVAGSST